MSNCAQDVLKVAAGEIGYYSANMDSKYGDWYAARTGEGWYADPWIAWCAMFVSWVFDRAGAKCVGLPGAYTPTMSNAAIRAGKTVPKYDAKPGDVVYFTWLNGGDYIDHVGIVELNCGSYLQTIEGNTSNAVMRRTRAWNVVGYVVRPDYDAAPVEQRVMPVEQEDGSVYRLYNPNSGEHFFTVDYGEAKGLAKVGWRSEGVGWMSPKAGDPVWRLFNANAGDHHYTSSADEKASLVEHGWLSEGMAFRSGGGSPVYRLYNQHAATGAHMLTTSVDEVAGLVRHGWRFEGVSFMTE